MKKATCLVCLLTYCLVSNAQDTNEIMERDIPTRWVSPKGFWVAEINKTHPGIQTIRYYTNENKLVLEEVVSGKMMKLRRPKHLRLLKEKLETAIGVFETLSKK